MVGRSQSYRSERKPRSDAELIRFLARYVVWRSPDGEFAIVRGLDADTNKSIVAKISNCYGLSTYPGDPVVLRGCWESHPRFGRQFRGVMLGEGGQDLVEAAQDAGLPEKDVQALQFVLGDTRRLALENPYVLLGRSRLGWASVDKLALHLGEKMESSRRAEAFVWFHLDNMQDVPAMRLYAERSASTWIPLPALMRITSAALGVPANSLPEILDDTECSRLSVIADSCQNLSTDSVVMLSAMKDAEDSLLFHVQSLTGHSNVEDGEISHNLSDQQRTAAAKAASLPVFLLSGAPGTGKTTCISAVSRAHLSADRYHSVSVAAFTGKAADRVSKVIRAANITDSDRISCSTIHRLLECKPDPAAPSGFVFSRSAGNPIDASLVVVDESSMVPTELLESLVSAMHPTSSLVLVGDYNQLLPLSPGIPFLDLIDSGCFESMHLDTIFRQASGSAIAESCRVMLRGSAPDFFDFLREEKSNGEISWLPCADDAIAFKAGQVAADISKDGSLPQVISPIKAYEGGTGDINSYFKGLFNPSGVNKCVTLADGFSASVGDPVIWIKNDYDRGVFNGDSFVIAKIGSGHNTGGRPVSLVASDGAELSITQQDCTRYLCMSYCLTVHKSQGSEWQDVIVCIPHSSTRMATRRLFYTACSRAKRRLWIIGSVEVIRKAIETDVPRPRTRFLELLRHPRT